MFELSLSSRQLSSSLYLQNLADNPQFDVFSFVGNNLLTPTQFNGADSALNNSRDFKSHSDDPTLVIFSEGLNLNKLFQVEQALIAELNIRFFKIVRMSGMTGYAIAARVNLRVNTDLRPKLETLATSHQIELCLFDKIPSLTEPGLLLMDMDSTVIAVECIDELAKLAGVGEQVSEVTELAMQGKLDFAESLRSRVGCLSGADVVILHTVLSALPLMPGLSNLVKILKKYNWKLAIASGGFTFFADYLLQRLELDAAVANKLEIIDGKLSGKVSGDIIDAKVKASTLDELAARWKIPHSQTIAMGDGANDLLMMNAASLGVAFHAKPLVRAQADISIRSGGLDCLLWILAAVK
ncbi:MAG: phosphoserine phosphatase [Paraglaciecola sp.]